ncbi:MAG: DUF4301 family protein [Candidatus Eisenbacteria bacterium]
MEDVRFTPADLHQLEARGVAEAEARRHLAIMAAPPAYADLVRPCTLGDGIDQLSQERLVRLAVTQSMTSSTHESSVFVPASGAASRMFKELLAELSTGDGLMPADVRARASAGDRDAQCLAAFVEGLPRFAFVNALEKSLAHLGHRLSSLRQHGPWRTLLATFLETPGLGYAHSPKGLVAFHREEGSVRTAFIEHLREASRSVRDGQGRVQMHFTVSPEHRAGFATLLAMEAPSLEAELEADFDVEFSEQHPATDTLAADSAGGPFRDDAGRLLFRPAGHGALLRNLQETQGDLVFLKNIDNVAVSRLKDETFRWSAALLGLVAQLQGEAHAFAAAIEAGQPNAIEGAAAFLAEHFGEVGLAGDGETLLAALDRPLRVAGMVPNTGEPGGGPFWVRGANGAVTRQIVEGAQVDPASAPQQAIAAQATHFNPVFLACALRDRNRHVHHLERFVDSSAVIITRRSHGGKDLVALERPGLWNGAMALWNTVFIEVPITVFNPVKGVLDLLRPEHQG